MFNHIDYIYAVYKERSFSRAAEKLYISQPAISLAIKKLEDELGYPLFVRRGKETVPTEFGEKYISAIEKIIRIREDLDAELDEILKLKRGKIRIGSTTIISIYILPEIIKGFKELYPNVTIDLSVDQSTVLKEKFELGELDIIIDNIVSCDEENDYHPLFEEQILIGVPSDSEFNKKYPDMAITPEDFATGNIEKRLDMRTLKNESFILLKEGNSMREIAENIFKEADICPAVSFEFDLLLSAVCYAESGLGVCFLTDTIHKRHPTGLSLYLPDTRFSRRTVYLIRKKNRYIGAAAKEFISLTTDYLKNKI